MKITKEKLSSVYSIVLVIFMPLGIYSSGISSLSLSDIVLVLLLPFLIIFNVSSRKSWRLFPPIMLFVTYVLINAFFLARTSGEWLRTARYCFYLLYIGLYSNKFFNYGKALNAYEKMSIFATMFLIVQFVLYRTVHIYLPGYLPFLNVTRDELINYSSNIYNTVSTAQRMRSIFQEPAQYSSYVSGCLALLMIENEDKNMGKCILLTVGLILSASATGIIVAIVCWSIFILAKIKEKITPIKIILGIIVICMSVILFRSSAFQLFLLRIENGQTVTNRFQGYSIVANLFSNSAGKILFGIGMDLFDIYLAGWSRMLLYFGVIGIFIYAAPMFFIACTSKRTFLICMLIFLLGTGTSILLSGNSMLLLSFMIAEIANVQNRSRNYEYKEANY